MSVRDDETSLRQMRDHAQEAIAIANGCSLQALESDRMLQLAVVRLLEVIGEAATRVSAATQSRHSAIPWRQIIGMRNRLIHAYDQVDLEMVWNVIAVDLQRLVDSLTTALGDFADPLG